jgi:hypothetical protein
MRAVTEPYSPPACDQLAPTTRNTERRALDTCAIDRRALDAVMADVAAISAEAELAVLPAAASPVAAVPPAWSQLLRLESLLCEWMTANSACDRAALAELRRGEANPPVRRAPTLSTANATVSAPSGNNNYVSQLAARLVRRSA